jgi:cytochrome c oxidase subunit 1
MGMPRRYHAYAPEFQVFNVMSTAGASILAVGFIVPAIYLLWSLWRGQIAPANPWALPGLEWRTTSPPPTENFPVTPVVTWEAYEFAPPEEMEVIGKFEPDDRADHPIEAAPQ